MVTHQTNTTGKSEALPVSLPEAKEQLRVVSQLLDGTIRDALNAAVDYCERVIGRSLRVSHTVVQSYNGWPCAPVRFDRQPVRSITSVTYYDADNAIQTVLAANYRLHTSSEGGAFLSFDSAFSRPAIYSRDDVVQITYVAGYATLADVPPVAKQAIRLQLEKDWGNKTPVEQDRMERSIQSLLTSCDWGCYR